jgi:preprotein translocase subunit SecD
MKEELRSGKTLRAAVRTGFDRAWPSIRDSNISTLITCVILFLFGANFGASIVQGFALTLAIGVLVSLFTAIIITRTFLNAVMQLWTIENRWWFGV